MKNGAPGSGAGWGPGPHGTAELQVAEDLPASDVADEEAEVLRVLEAGGRVVQKCPGGFVQRRAQSAPSLSPPGQASGQNRGPSSGEPAAPGGQGGAKGRGRSAGVGRRQSREGPGKAGVEGVTEEPRCQCTRGSGTGSQR